MARHLPLYSPTKIKLFRRCPRAGAFRHIDRVQVPQSPWAASGTRMHSVPERYAKGEEPDLTDPEARVAMAVVGYWPEGVEWQPEARVRIEREGFSYSGTADQLGLGFVGDYKFTGARKNLPDGRSHWVRALWPRAMRGVKDDALIEQAADELYYDPQWIIYGNGAGPDEHGEVHGLWTYVVKPPKMQGEPKILPVELCESFNSLQEKLAALDREVLTIEWISANYQSANDVPHDADGACGGVGIYCDYAHKCTLKGESMKFDELMAKATGGADPNAKATPEPEKEAAPAETPKVNPPEGDEADTQATAEEVEEKHPSGRKKKKKAAKKTTKKTVNEAADEAPDPPAEGFEALIESAGAGEHDTHITLVAAPSTVVPVGARVRITVVK